MKRADDKCVVRFERGTPSVRLFCFSHAGGGTAAFAGWPASVPAGLEVCAIRLPGRETRLFEPPLKRLAQIVESVEPAIRPYLDVPFAFFGHSMGGLVAFELTRQLRRRGKALPFRLFPSATRAPRRAPRPPFLHTLTDAQIVDELRLANGTPREVLDDARLMELFLPMIRGDFEAVETYEHVPEAPLPVPITAFGGTFDHVIRQSALEAWREETARDFSLRLLPGDHFFLHSARAQLLEEVAKDISPELGQLGVSTACAAGGHR